MCHMGLDGQTLGGVARAELQTRTWHLGVDGLEPRDTAFNPTVPTAGTAEEGPASGATLPS